MSRTAKEQEKSRDALEVRFHKAVVEHFEELGYEGKADAGDIVVASCTLLTAYLTAVPMEARSSMLDSVVANLRREVLGAGHA